eukprot:1162113-Pelagomonas_calceolata.AAC.4
MDGLQGTAALGSALACGCSVQRRGMQSLGGVLHRYHHSASLRTRFASKHCVHILRLACQRCMPGSFQKKRNVAELPGEQGDVLRTFKGHPHGGTERVSRQLHFKNWSYMEQSMATIPALIALCQACSVILLNSQSQEEQEACTEALKQRMQG